MEAEKFLFYSLKLPEPKSVNFFTFDTADPSNYRIMFRRYLRGRFSFLSMSLTLMIKHITHEVEALWRTLHLKCKGVQLHVDN